MATIRKTTPGESFIHNHGTVAGGETIDVDADTAEYLTENGGYEYVEPDGESEAADADGGNAEQSLALSDEYINEKVDAGVCPWCEGDDGYEGDHVGQHASSAHPDEWDEYQGEA